MIPDLSTLVFPIGPTISIGSNLFGAINSPASSTCLFKGGTVP